MRAVHDYIITPVGDRYNNSIDVEGKSLIINTEIFNHQYVNREAEVLAVPTSYKSDIKKGDTIIVHHNVFRRWHNVRGQEKNSRSYYKDDKYFVREDQVFAYKRNNKWKATEGYCFVKPIKSVDKFDIDKERPLLGILKYTDDYLLKSNINKGDLVGFTPSSEFEFVIDGQRLYRVPSKDITIKYEYQGDEEEYNPSWA
jgi:hypothetical protein